MVFVGEQFLELYNLFLTLWQTSCNPKIYRVGIQNTKNELHIYNSDTTKSFGMKTGFYGNWEMKTRWESVSVCFLDLPSDHVCGSVDLFIWLIWPSVTWIHVCWMNSSLVHSLNQFIQSLVLLLPDLLPLLLLLLWVADVWALWLQRSASLH